MTRLSRLVVLVVVGVVAAGVVAADRFTTEPDAPQSQLARVTPTANPVSSPTSTWYCAAGTASGDGVAEQTVIITNPTGRMLDATVTGFTDDAEQAATTVSLDPHSRTPVRIAEVVGGQWAGALIETDGGAVAVDHFLAGPDGATLGPCASSASDVWYLPAGSTELGVDNVVALFNPFAQLAVVDLGVVTDEGTRTVPQFQGLLVEPQSVRVIDLSDVVTVRDQVAVTVATRTGLVVAERLEVTGSDADQPRALAVTQGAPTPAQAWYFPTEVELSDGVDLSFVVFNPTGDAADVDVQLLVDDPDIGFIEPFEVTVRPGQFTVINPVDDDDRVPDGALVAAYVEARNGVDVVAVQVVRTTGRSPYGRGASISVGSPVLATEWVMPLGGVRNGDPVQLGITNLGVRDAELSIDLVSDGELVATTPITATAGSRAVIDVAALDGYDDRVEPGSLSVVVRSTHPVVVGRYAQFLNNRGFALSVGIVADNSGSWPPVAQPEVVVPPTVVIDDITTTTTTTTTTPAPEPEPEPEPAPAPAPEPQES